MGGFPFSTNQTSLGLEGITRDWTLWGDVVRWLGVSFVGQPNWKQLKQSGLESVKGQFVSMGVFRAAADQWNKQPLLFCWIFCVPKNFLWWEGVFIWGPVKLGCV